MSNCLDDEVLSRVGWDLPGHQPGSRFGIEELREEYWVFFKFLQDNGLTTRVLAQSPEDITADTELTAGDLTDEGNELFDTGYQRWLQALDRAGPAGRLTKIHDTRILQKYLDKIRGKPPSKLPGRRSETKLGKKT